MLYVISYDLKSKKDYTKFYQWLESKNAMRILETTYLLNSAKSAKELRDECCNDLDDNDGLLIAEVTQNSVWSNTAPSASWIRK